MAKCNRLTLLPFKGLMLRGSRCLFDACSNGQVSVEWSSPCML